MIRAASTSQMKSMNPHRFRWTLAAAFVACLGIGATMTVAPEVASADGAACGATGQPPCPLQKWMRLNLGAAQTNGDAAALATGLTKTAALNPDPTWTDWVKMSNDGAAAAGKGDIAGAKASCNSCHQKYKADYKAKYRMKAVP
jgi:hypothetical protein